MKRIILITVMALALVAQARTVRDFFASEPDDLFMLLPHNARLDMLDYYDSGQTVDMRNNLGDSTRLIDLTDNYLKVQMSSAKHVEIRLLNWSKRDTIIAVVETVFTPVPDSRITFYNSNWSPLETIRPLKMPTIDDFFLPAANRDMRNKVHAAAPFFCIELTFTGTDHDVLVARHNLRRFLDADDYAAIAPALRESISYQIKGAKFKKL